MTAQHHSIKIGIIIFFVNAAASSNHNILIYIFQQINMGHVATISLFLRYLSYFISSLLAPSIKMSLNKLLILSVAGCFCNYLIATLVLVWNNPTYIFLGVSIGYILDGISTPILYVCQGRYCHLVCQLFNVQDNRGHVLGIYQLLYSFSFVVGSITTYTCIGFFSNQVYFCCLTVSLLLALLGSIFFLDNLQTISGQALQQYEGDQRENIQRERVDNVMQEEKYHQSADHFRLRNALSNMFNKMAIIYYILPFFLYEGLATVIKMNQISHLVPSDFEVQKKNKLVGLCIIFSAIGSFSSSYLLSYATDIVGTIRTANIVAIGLTFTCLMHILTTFIESVDLAYITAFFWGFISNAFYTVISVICSKHLGGSKQVYSINRFVYATTITFFQISMTITHNNLGNLATLLIGAFSILLLLCNSKLPDPKQQIQVEIKSDKSNDTFES